jgi:hypothetical protein
VGGGNFIVLSADGLHIAEWWADCWCAGSISIRAPPGYESRVIGFISDRSVFIMTSWRRRSRLRTKILHSVCVLVIIHITLTYCHIRVTIDGVWVDNRTCWTLLPHTMVHLWRWIPMGYHGIGTDTQGNLSRNYLFVAKDSNAVPSRCETEPHCHNSYSNFKGILTHDWHLRSQDDGYQELLKKINLNHVICLCIKTRTSLFGTTCGLYVFLVWTPII